MYAIQWTTYKGTHEAICAKSRDAWEIYWQLKKSYHRMIQPIDSYWIQIYDNGVPCNPERGGALPPCKPGEGPLFCLVEGIDHGKAL